MSKNHRPATPVQSVQVGSTQETLSDTPETDAEVIEALVPFTALQHVASHVVPAKLARTLEHQRDEARRELSDTQKLMNIYRGAVTSAVNCETHKDVIAEHCPVCLLNERDQLREQLAARRPNQAITITAQDTENAVWDEVVNSCLRAWPDKRKYYNNCPTELIDDLINERDEARRDSSRYRWLRDHRLNTISFVMAMGWGPRAYSAEEADTLIDERIAQEKKS